MRIGAKRILSNLSMPLFEPSLLRTEGFRKGKYLKAFSETWCYRFGKVGMSLRENERKLSSYRNCHQGERCVVIGNGPSLNKCDLSLCANEVTFGVNAIYLNEDKMGFAPTYYVLEDPLVAEDRKDEILSYDKPREKFIGSHLKDILGELDDGLWLNSMYDYSEYRNFPNFSKDAGHNVWVGGTVTYMVLQLAYFMGFREVYMVGFDHNYVIPKEHEVDGTKITSTTDDPNHFNPSYFGKGYRWHDPRVDRMELAFEKAKTYFEKDGRKIFNVTVGGKLEVFERKCFEDVFSK